MNRVIIFERGNAPFGDSDTICCCKNEYYYCGLPLDKRFVELLINQHRLLDLVQDIQYVKKPISTIARQYLAYSKDDEVWNLSPLGLKEYENTLACEPIALALLEYYTKPIKTKEMYSLVPKEYLYVVDGSIRATIDGLNMFFEIYENMPSGQKSKLNRDLCERCLIAQIVLEQKRLKEKNVLTSILNVKKTKNNSLTNTQTIQLMQKFLEQERTLDAECKKKLNRIR